MLAEEGKTHTKPSQIWNQEFESGSKKDSKTSPAMLEAIAHPHTSEKEPCLFFLVAKKFGRKLGSFLTPSKCKRNVRENLIETTKTKKYPSSVTICPGQYFAISGPRQVVGGVTQAERLTQTMRFDCVGVATVLKAKNNIFSASSSMGPLAAMWSCVLLIA